nr:uncharacterized protein LOC109617426 isoform X2 [Crassostrea gigas]
MQLIGFVVVLLFVQSVTSDAMAKRKRGPNMIPNVPDSITDEVQSVTNDAMAKRNSKWPIVMIKRNFKWPIAMIKRNFKWPIAMHKRGPPLDY